MQGWDGKVRILEKVILWLTIGRKVRMESENVMTWNNIEDDHQEKRFQ